MDVVSEITTLVILPLLVVCAILPVTGLLWFAQHQGLRFSRNLFRRPIRGAETPLADLDIAHLEPAMAELARTTRHLLIDLQGLCANTRDWGDRRLHGLGQGDGVFQGAADSSDAPANHLVREVWLWHRHLETMPLVVRDRLRDRGIEAKAIAELALSDLDASEKAERVLTALVDVDRRLHCDRSDPYRDRGGGEPACNPPHATDDDTSDREREFAELWRKHGALIASICRRHVRTASEADDLLQDVKLEIWRSLPRFRGESSLRTYVARITRFRCIDHLRRRRDFDPTPVLVDEDFDPERELDLLARRDRVRSAMAELPESLAEVLRLSLHDHSHREIAQRVGITESNVSVRVSRARARLRRRLAPSPV